MHLGGKVTVVFTIEQGAIYLTEIPLVIGEHFFIVLNKNPQKDGFALLTPGTTRQTPINFIKLRNIDPATVVLVPEIDGQNYGLSKDTFFNCNSHYQHSLNGLSELGDSGKLKYKGRILTKYLDLMVIGIKKSPLVPRNIKNLVI